MKITAPYFPNHIVSEEYKTVKEAKNYLENTKTDYVWLNQFERKGQVVNAIVLAVSTPTLDLMDKLGIGQEVRNIVSEGKLMLLWFNLFAEYMGDENKGNDKNGAVVFKQAQQGMYGLTLQHKQVVPLIVSIRVEELGGKIEYLTLVMSEKFIVKGKKDIILVNAAIEKLPQKEYDKLKATQRTVSFICDTRSPQKRCEQEATMMDLFNQTKRFTSDPQNFIENIRNLLKKSDIPVHFNTKEFIVTACSGATLQFTELSEGDIIDKSVLHFRLLVQNRLDLSFKHYNQFLEIQDKYAEMLKQGHPLPDTHVAVRFKGRKNFYIIHFHREDIYTNEGQLLGTLVFMPFEEIPPKHFLLLEQTDSFIVEEEAIILDEAKELSESARTEKEFINVDQELDKIEIEVNKLLKELELE